MTAITFETEFFGVEKDLRNFAIKLTRDIVDADDLFQETALKAFRYRESFKPGSKFKSWASTIMYNTFVNIYRKKRRRKTSSEPIETTCFNKADKNFQNPVDIIASNEINFHIQMLKPKFKEPFLLHLSGYKYHEIANEYDVPIGTIKSRISSARKTLRDVVEAL